MPNSAVTPSHYHHRRRRPLRRQHTPVTDYGSRTQRFPSCVRGTPRGMDVVTTCERLVRTIFRLSVTSQPWSSPGTSVVRNKDGAILDGGSGADRFGIKCMYSVLRGLSYLWASRSSSSAIDCENSERTSHQCGLWKRRRTAHTLF
jgi:hypothetical protein